MNTKIFLFFCCCLMQIAARAQAANEILWDKYGVPHIYAQSAGRMYYEFGWAQMHNHANLLLRLYGQARGRAAEYWGEKYLASDKQVHLFDVPSQAGRNYAAQNPLFRGMLDSFVNGINDFAKAHPDAISQENHQVLPVTGTDVLAHGIRVIFLTFVAGGDLGAASRKSGAGSNSYAVGPSRSAKAITPSSGRPQP